MASQTPSSKHADARPKPLRTTKSFPRADEQPPASPGARSQRASTIQNGAPPKVTALGQAPASIIKVEEESPDAFETSQGDDPSEPPRTSVDLDDLPIELIGLTDSFIESLSTKTYPTPPTIDYISGLFQDFYAHASSHINTHIATLLSRHNRENSPAPSTSSKASAASLLRGKAASIGSKDKPKPGTPTIEHAEQQMITADELAERKRARKAIEQKRGVLEEAVERRLCEGIYDRIYRHRSTQDEAQDDKLRSKTAALAVVGIGIGDLGIQLGDASEPPEVIEERTAKVRKSLDHARNELIAMNETRYPLGKLNRLKAVHKSIVDTLSQFHPSSSADEIMPMLIYTLITLQPENLNVISDLNFIQRFRWEQKLTGEAAYCLTNLEAAISFLETVDLSTLRADEAPSGPLKSNSRPGTPRTETFPLVSTPGLSLPATSSEVIPSTAVGSKPAASPSSGLRAVQLRNRRLSDLVNTPAQALGAASDAVFKTADQGLKDIGNSLGDSYKFLLGKLRAQDGPPGASGEALVPKTLDDARKLIGTPPPDDDASVESSPLVDELESRRRASKADDKMLNLISGRKASRDHSADSSRSASSSKKVAFAEEAREKGGPSPATLPLAAATNPAIIDSMRNFGSSLNPMAKFAGIGGFRGFGRTASTPAAPTLKDGKAAATDGGDLATAFPDIAAALPPKETPKIAPPVKRFMELQNPADLRIGEVLELLRDYRRLAGALKEMDAFKE